MTRITARVPVRADLAGGTLDLWPLYLYNPGSRTVNVAISIFAECVVETLPDPSIEVVMEDAGVEGRFASLADLRADDRMALFARVLEHFELTGLRITTRTEAPRGSGLGGSSALAIALVRAMSILAGRPVDGDALIHLVRDLEARLIGIPTGVQDYYPPVYGGLAALHLDPGEIVRHPITLSLPDLGRHLILHYSGVSHFSGTNNWQMYKGFIDGDRRMREGLAEISRISVLMENALIARDFAAAGKALADEWQARKRLVDGISTPEVDAVIEAATHAGAWAGKVCGAGGGGCIVILSPAEARDAVIAALAKAPGSTLDISPVPNGITVEEDREAAPFRPSRRAAIAGATEIEQLWLAGTGGAYRPHVLAEAAITFDAPRHGLHRTITRTFLAPVEPQSGLPRWTESDRIDIAQLDLRTSPEPGRETLAPREPADLIERAAEGEDRLKELLLETEKLTFFFNPRFEMFSQPHETRDEFLRRCLERADQGLEDESERLEKTFRRRIDQMREKADREQRDIEETTEEGAEDARHQQVGIAWGQTLYNITSGRPATSDAPRSRNEADYLEKITQLQKSWEREQEVLRDELTARARAIEEVVLEPEPRGIETRRYVILWVPESA